MRPKPPALFTTGPQAVGGELRTAPSSAGRVDSRPVLLTVDETAQLLRTTRKAVYALIERRQIPGVTKLGRRVLVRSDELLDWLRQKSECHR